MTPLIKTERTAQYLRECLHKSHSPNRIWESDLEIGKYNFRKKLVLNNTEFCNELRGSRYTSVCREREGTNDPSLYGELFSSNC